MTTSWLAGSSTGLAPTLVTATAGLLLLLLWLALRQPLLWRMGLRNTVRRPAQSVLLLCGLVLSTVVITASFGLQDSVTDSTLSHRLAAMGQVDASVSGPFTSARVATVLARLRRDPRVRAATGIVFYPEGAGLSSPRTGLGLHNLDLYAVPPDFDRVYGPLTDLHGRPVSLGDLRPDEVVLSATTARGFNVQTGERIRVNLGFQVITSTVRAVLAGDLGLTTGEAVDAGSLPQVILPLGLYQRLYERATQQPQPPDVLLIAAHGPGNRAAVVRLLRRLFPDGSISLDATSGRLGQTDPNEIKIHPLQPDVAHVVALQVTKVVFYSPAGQQFSWLPPLFTLLFVGAGMLLLALLVILLATERRAELGMGRALGMQRRQLVQLLLFEGCGYGVAGALIGVPLGVAATALELSVLAGLPQLGPGESGGNAVAIPVMVPLHLWVSWQSLLSAWCLSVLATGATVVAIGLWIGRASIVAAIHDLDEPPGRLMPLRAWWQLLWTPPLAADGRPIAETPARRRARRAAALGGLLWGLWARGPVIAALGAACLFVDTTDVSGWYQLGPVLLIAGAGLAVRWLVPLGARSAARQAIARRLGASLIGVGWLAAGLRPGNAFLALFQPVVAYSGPPSAVDLLLATLLPVAGAVVLILTNADLIAAGVAAPLRRVPGLRPIGRLSLAYPLTHRLRTGVTVALLGLVTFLVLFLVAINLGAIQGAQAATATGGFQLQATVFGSQLYRDAFLAPRLRAIQTHRLLSRDFAAVGLLRLLYDLPVSGLPQPIRLGRPGGAIYRLNSPPLVADDGFLARTTLPLYARARGFASDHAVWEALRTKPGDVVLQYDSSSPGLPTSTGFAPFAAEIPDRAAPGAHYQRVTVIGLIAADAPWRVLLSIRTAARIARPPSIIFINTYLFRVASGVSELDAARALSGALATSSTGITVQSLDHGDLNGITAVITLFLGGDLALGLLFGALAIGVISGRSVIERRQQIGMLRAMGFSRGLVRRAFLLEASGVITLGLLIGAALALWLAAQVARLTGQHIPLPLGPIALILAGSYMVTVLSTVWPARQAARLPPAEVLRYE